MIAQRLEEATNVHIDWTVYVDDQFGEKKQLALAKKELPDMVFDAQMSQYDLLRYAKDGTIIAVDDLIDQYMPNLKRFWMKTAVSCADYRPGRTHLFVPVD